MSSVRGSISIKTTPCPVQYLIAGMGTIDVAMYSNKLHITISGPPWFKALISCKEDFVQTLILLSIGV